jgi:transglutaminase-like putative cysteine protease
MADSQIDNGKQSARATSLPGVEEGVYLQETPCCDYGHPLIQEILSSVTLDCTDEREKAKRIFYHVRDGIRFALIGSGVEITASKTARIGYGDCGSKTNLQIALLRATGIPARMRAIMAEVTVLQGLIPDLVYTVSTRFYKEDFHFWPECYIDGEWIACEGLFDKTLYEAALRKGLFTPQQIPTIDWDGETSLVLLHAWRTKDLGSKPSWDEWYVEFKKKISTPRIADKFMEWTLAPLCRRKTDQVRTYPEGEGK